MALAPLAEPPDGFEIPLPLVELECPWYRVHERARDAEFFNRTATYRFNSPEGKFGVLYAAEKVEPAFAETFLRFGKRPPVVQLRALELRTVSSLLWSRPLILVDLAGMGSLRLGLDARIGSADDYGLCQRWARWLNAHPALPDGILYRARTAPDGRSVALFDRVGSPVLCKQLVPSLASPDFSDQLGAILESSGAVVL